MRARAIAGAVVVAGAMLSCRKQPAAPTCSDRVEAFDEALSAAGAGTCKVDADCKCFRGGISDKHGCGGVTDAKTNDRLTRIAADYDAARCQSGIACAASVCTPACRAGRCVDGPPPSVAASCEARVDEIDRVLASAKKACRADADCACFRGGVSKKDPCGGVTDVATNARFEALAKEWRAAGCKNDDVMCPAMVCRPQCNAGTCGAPTDVIQ